MAITGDVLTESLRGADQARCGLSAFTYELREASTEDLDACVVMLRSAGSCQSIFGTDLRSGELEQWLAERLACGAPHGPCLVAHLPGESEAVAMCALWDGGLCFVVDPSHRRLGLASRMVRRLCDRIRAKGAQRIEATVFQDNYWSQAVLRKVGFEFEGTSPVRIRGKSVPVPLMRFFLPFTAGC